MGPTIRATASTTIDRDIDAVWDFVAHIPNMDRWVTGVTGTELGDGRGDREGDQFEFDYTSNGRTAPMRVVVTTRDAPSRLVLEAIDGPFDFASEIVLTRSGDGTEISNTIEPGADGRFTALMFTVLRPALRWLMTRQLRSELEELKAVLEEDEATESEVHKKSIPPEAGQA